MKFNIVSAPGSTGAAFTTALAAVLLQQAKYDVKDNKNSSVTHPRMNFQRFIGRKATQHYKDAVEARQQLVDAQLDLYEQIASLEAIEVDKKDKEAVAEIKTAIEKSKSDLEKVKAKLAATKEPVKLTHTDVCAQLAEGTLNIVQDEAYTFIKGLAKTVKYSGMLGESDIKDALKILSVDYMTENRFLNPSDYMEEKDLAAVRQTINPTEYLQTLISATPASK